MQDACHNELSKHDLERQTGVRGQGGKTAAHAPRNGDRYKFKMGDDESHFST